MSLPTTSNVPSIVRSLREHSHSIANELGRLIKDSTPDSEGRIHLNPIVTVLRKKCGIECRVGNFRERSSDLLEKLAKQQGKALSDNYQARGGTGGGTLVIPHLAVLLICYFWDDFNASDVYHRYVTNDVSLAVEIVENSAEKEGLTVMKLAEMQTKMEEFMATERNARMELEAKLEEKTELLEGRITVESKKRKLEAKAIKTDVKGIEEQVDDLGTNINQELDERATSLEDLRQEVFDKIEVPLEVFELKSKKSMKTVLTAIRRWWNECTEPSDGAKLWIAEEIVPEFRRWAVMTGHDGPTLTGQFQIYTDAWIKSGDISSLSRDDRLEKADREGRIRKREGYVG